MERSVTETFADGGVRLIRKGRRASIVLSNPGKMNAMRLAMWEALGDVCLQLLDFPVERPGAGRLLVMLHLIELSSQGVYLVGQRLGGGLHIRERPACVTDQHQQQQQNRSRYLNKRGGAEDNRLLAEYRLVQVYLLVHGVHPACSQPFLSRCLASKIWRWRELIRQKSSTGRRISGVPRAKSGPRASYVP